MDILGPKNNEFGDTELNNTGKNCQEKNDLIIQNDLSDAYWNQIIDIIEEIEPIIMGKLDDGTWMHCEPHLFF